MHPQKETTFALILAAVYATLTGLLLPYHEPWADEAQAWLIARDLNPGQILEMMGYEGTPALWHFLLYPFAQLGAPYVSMQILHLAIATLAVFLFARHAPFSRLFKVLFAGSYWMAYELAIVSRNYGMGVLALVLVATTFQDRMKKPIPFALSVAFLANTNAQGIFFATAFGLVFLYDALKTGTWKRFLFPLGVMVGAGVVAAFQIAIQPDSSVLQLAPRWEQVAMIVRNTFPAHVFFPDPFSYVISFIIAATILGTLLTKSRALFLLLAGYAGTAFIFIKYPVEMGGRHTGLVLVLVCVALWISTSEKPATHNLSKTPLARYLSSQPVRATAVGMLQLMFFVTIGLTYTNFILDWEKPYSNSRLMAVFIDKHLPAEMPIAAHHAWRSISLLPYLPGREFYYPTTDSWGTFQINNEDYKTQEALLDKDQLNERSILFERVERAFPEDRPALLLNDPLPDPEARDYVLIHTETDLTSEYYHYEKYYLYLPVEYLGE